MPVSVRAKQIFDHDYLKVKVKSESGGPDLEVSSRKLFAGPMW